MTKRKSVGLTEALRNLTAAAKAAGREVEEYGEFEDADLKFAALDYYVAWKRASTPKDGAK